MPSNKRYKGRLPEASKAFRYKPYRPTETRAVAVRIPLKKPSIADAFLSDNATEAYKPFRNRLIFYINKVTDIRRLYISSATVKDVLAIVYTIEGYIGFTRYYKRVISL